MHDCNTLPSELSAWVHNSCCVNLM